MWDLLGYLTIGLIPGIIVIDWALRGRKHDSTRFWRLRATIVTIAIFLYCRLCRRCSGARCSATFICLTAADPRHLGRRHRRHVLVYEFFSLLVSPRRAQLRLAVARRSSDAPQRREPRRIRRVLSAPDSMPSTSRACRESGLFSAARPDNRGRASSAHFF